MGKVIGLLVTVVGIWAGVEVATHGVDGAFDGAFAREGATSAERVTTPQRAGRAVEAAHGASDERRARMLGE